MKAWRLIIQISKTLLFSKRKQTIVAALGVTFGIASYITLVGFMTGLNRMLDDLIINQTPHIHIYNEIKPTQEQPIHTLDTYRDAFQVVRSVKPKYRQSNIHNAMPLLEHLRGLPEVQGALPQVKTQILYLSGTLELGGTMTGIDPISQADLFNLDDYFIEGTASDLKNNENGIIIGYGIAQKMSVKPGDRIQVLNSLGERYPLKIVGIYQSGFSEVDNVQSFVNLKTVQRILGVSGSYVTDIQVKLYDLELAGSMAENIAREHGVTAVDIKTANAQFETGTSIRNMITYAVSVALLIVAGFGIYNILNMLIYEKLNDIAILKAIGFSGKDVQWIFLSQALFIGLAGGILGLLVGFGLSSLIDRTPFETEALPTITTFPVVFDLQYYITGIVFALLCTFFAGYFPSLRAKHVDPVTIITGQ